MTKCMKCGVYITDNTDKCPLCQQVVAPVELSSDNHQGTEGVFEQHNDVPDKCVNDTDSAARGQIVQQAMTTVRDILTLRAHQENTDYWKISYCFCL